MKGEYGEPWRVDAYGVIREHDGMPVDARSPVVHRIIACVNALDGLDPEALREYIEAASDLRPWAGKRTNGTHDVTLLHRAADRFDRAEAALTQPTAPESAEEKG